MKDTPLRAMALMGVFAITWVLLEEVLGARLSRPYPLLEIVWIRYAVHLTLMVLISLPTPSRLWRTGRPVFHLARSLLMLVMPASYALSLAAGVPSGSVWALFWVAPLMVLALAGPVFGDRPSARLWVVSGLGTLAAAAMMAERGTALGLSLVLPLVMAASFAGYVVMTRQLDGERLQANLFYTALGVFVALTPIVPWTWVEPSVHDFETLAGIGVAGLVTLWALDRAVSAAPVSSSVPALYLHLPALVLVGWAVGHEAPLHRQAAGGALISAALAWLAVSTWRASRRGTGRGEGVIRVTKGGSS